MIYRVGKAIQKYWKYPAGAVAAISTLTNLQTFHSHSQINSGHKPDGIYPECVKNFNSSIYHPPGLRPIACSLNTTNIQINNQNARQIAEGIIGKEATAKYGIQNSENYPAPSISINLDLAQISKMEAGSKTPYSLFQGGFMNSPRIKQYIATFGKESNRAFCSEGDFFKIAFFSKSIQRYLVHPENFTKHTILTSQKPF